MFSTRNVMLMVKTFQLVLHCATDAIKSNGKLLTLVESCSVKILTLRRAIRLKLPKCVIRMCIKRM